MPCLGDGPGVETTFSGSRVALAGARPCPELAHLLSQSFASAVEVEVG